MVDTVGISLNAFKDTPLAELCFDDALKIGAHKSEKTKATDFSETSIRFCVEGLQIWFSSYVRSYCDCSFHAAVRDISWHWASFCETDPTMVKLRTVFDTLQQQIIENTAYVDLAERMRERVHVREFGMAGRRPYGVVLPMEAVGVINQTGEALGIGFSKFFQVGLGWSLSTNRQGMYKEWVTEVYSPLLDTVLTWAEEKIKDLEEIEVTLHNRVAHSVTQYHRVVRG